MPTLAGTERPQIDESPLRFNPLRHNKFYIEHIVFLAEDILFKVPRAEFAAIEVFGTVFTLPVAGNTPEGSDDEHPFGLPVKEAEFRAFLRVLYPNDTPLRTADFSEEECISVLKLADMWELPEYRDMVINELSSRTMNPFTKVLLARQYNIHTWLRVTYQHLVNRKEIITGEEAKQLGWDTAIQIFHLRDKAMTSAFELRGRMSEEVPWHISETDINAAFAEELKDVTEEI